MRLLRLDLWWLPIAIVVAAVVIRRLTRRRAVANELVPDDNPWGLPLVVRR